jgi:hypothetical protein
MTKNVHLLRQLLWDAQMVKDDNLALMVKKRLNRDLIEEAFSKTVFFPRYSAEQLDTLADYPKIFSCSK